jgi:hypothetical protein
MKLCLGQEHRLQSQILFRALSSKKLQSVVDPVLVAISYRRTIFQEEPFELGESVLFWGVFCSVIVLIGFLFLFLGGHRPR